MQNWDSHSSENQQSTSNQFTPQTLIRKSTICLQSFQFLLVIASVCLLMQMEVFGAVDTMERDNWDWETSMIEIFQNKSQTFQKSNHQLRLVIHQYILIVKDQFGPVGTINVDNWGWEIQGTEKKQKRFKDFLQSNQLLEDAIIHCFLIVKDQFGPVGGMKKENSGWETKKIEIKQKRFKDFLQSNQWLEDGTIHCFWTSKAMFGFVERIKTGNWGWATQHKSTHHRKTTIFLELLLLEEGRIIQCFWTMQEIFTLVDEAGRVWSCGKNGYGQLGLGHSHQTLTFQKIENQAADNKEALQEAIDTGNLDCVKELVAKHGAEIFSAYTKSDYKRKETVIHRAINQNQTEVALYILKQQKSLVRVMVKHQDFRGETPLHRCGWCGRSKIAEELIKLEIG